MRNASDRSCREIKKKMQNFFFLESPAIYEIVWIIMVKPERSQITI